MWIIICGIVGVINGMSINVMDVSLAGVKEYKKIFFISYICVGRLNIYCDIFTMG